MTYDPQKHHRRSIRLKGYDYSQEGAYFVTICTHNRERLFGNIINSQMELNEYGHAVVEGWLKTPELRPNVELDEFIVMPNHLHGIIIICRGVLQYAPTTESMPISNSLLRSPSQTIGAIVRGFKGAVTKQINQMRDLPETPIWQRNYYESIISTENDLHRTREYIINNPAQWDLDEENPANNKSVGAYCNTPLHRN
ncbi:transposase [Anabaena azotica]|uniref:transposase n=1 Tax=Anabaena azotica TaxID=197653 RepID=UPI0039A550D1